MDNMHPSLQSSLTHEGSPPPPSTPLSLPPPLPLSPIRFSPFKITSSPVTTTSTATTLMPIIANPSVKLVNSSSPPSTPTSSPPVTRTPGSPTRSRNVALTDDAFIAATGPTAVMSKPTKVTSSFYPSLLDPGTGAIVVTPPRLPKAPTNSPASLIAAGRTPQLSPIQPLSIPKSRVAKPDPTGAGTVPGSDMEEWSNHPAIDVKRSDTVKTGRTVLDIQTAGSDTVGKTGQGTMSNGSGLGADGEGKGAKEIAGKKEKKEKAIPRAPGVVKWTHPPPKRLDRDFVYGFGFAGSNCGGAGSPRELKRFLEGVFEGQESTNGERKERRRNRAASLGNELSMGIGRSVSGRLGRGREGSPGNMMMGEMVKSQQDEEGEEKENTRPQTSYSGPVRAEDGAIGETSLTGKRKMRSVSAASVLDFDFGVARRKSKKEARERCHVLVSTAHAPTSSGRPGTAGPGIRSTGFSGGKRDSSVRGKGKKVKYGRIVNSEDMRRYTDAGLGDEREIFVVNDREEGTRRRRKVSAPCSITTSTTIGHSVAAGGEKRSRVGSSDRPSRFSEALDREMDDVDGVVMSRDGVSSKGARGEKERKERERLEVARSWLATPRAPSLHFDPNNYFVDGSAITESPLRQAKTDVASSDAPPTTPSSPQKVLAPGPIVKSTSTGFVGIGGRSMHKTMGSVGSMVALAKGLRTRSRSPSKKGKGSVDESSVGTGGAKGNRFRRFVEFYAKKESGQQATPYAGVPPERPPRPDEMAPERDDGATKIVVPEGKGNVESEGTTGEGSGENDAGKAKPPTHSHSKSISTVSTLSIKDAKAITLSRPGTPKAHVSANHSPPNPPPSSSGNPGPAPTAALPPVPEATSIPLPSTPSRPKTAVAPGTPTTPVGDSLSLFPNGRSSPRKMIGGESRKELGGSSPSKTPSVRVKIRSGIQPPMPSLSLQSSPARSTRSSPGRNPGQLQRQVEREANGHEWLLKQVESLYSTSTTRPAISADLPALTRPATANPSSHMNPDGEATETKTIDFAFLDRDPIPSCIHTGQGYAGVNEGVGSPPRKSTRPKMRGKRNSHITELMVDEYSEEGSLGSEEADVSIGAFDGGGVANRQEDGGSATTSTDIESGNGGGGCRLSVSGIIVNVSQAPTPPSRPASIVFSSDAKLLSGSINGRSANGQFHHPHHSMASTLSATSSSSNYLPLESGGAVEARLSRIERMFETMMVALSAGTGAANGVDGGGEGMAGEDVEAWAKGNAKDLTMLKGMERLRARAGGERE